MQNNKPIHHQARMEVPAEPLCWLKSQAQTWPGHHFALPPLVGIWQSCRSLYGCAQRSAPGWSLPPLNTACKIVNNLMSQKRTSGCFMPSLGTACQAAAELVQQAAQAGCYCAIKATPCRVPFAHNRPDEQVGRMKCRRCRQL